ncbi:hypothetical protein LOAG_18366 [Loa loa]|uniref:Uncharacterized protein n=1 Tax=Loa loa TaxID=7209 RepID=A0A1I7VWM2_LOALO|nr:hypothetical protein LOAG_18366 [Loa loa]EJD74303.1 hypothetical protein LOAG_18366 [Loa loa]
MDEVEGNNRQTGCNQPVIAISILASNILATIVTQNMQTTEFNNEYPDSYIKSSLIDILIASYVPLP